MIKIEKDVSLSSSYPLERLGKKEELVFFDIETTGFSGSSSTMYLIGCTFFQENRWHLLQWFADTRSCEDEILDEFFAFIRRFKTLVHFNGDTFDIPYLKKRCQALSLSHSFDGLESIDIYKKIKPYKQLLHLDSLKQKSIEAFLGIAREDVYSGGQLIEVYEEFLETKKESLLKFLLLHNEDDLKGMPQILPILFYPDFFSQPFHLLRCAESDDGSKLSLLLEGDRDTRLPIPLRAADSSYSLCAAGSRLELSIPIFDGTLKYFYSNYKDYYYLTCEDTAIHKSVAEFVDRSVRVKATKETCYTKKCSRFLPQPSALWTPEFKCSAREKDWFFEYSPGCFDDEEKLNEYLRQIFRRVSQ